jgi:flagellar hook-basal body complex protein FliE
MILNPDSVDAHDVSVAAAKAQMSLNITKSVVERAVKSVQGYHIDKVGISFRNYCL